MLKKLDELSFFELLNFKFEGLTKEDRTTIKNTLETYEPFKFEIDEDLTEVAETAIYWISKNLNEISSGEIDDLENMIYFIRVCKLIQMLNYSQLSKYPNYDIFFDDNKKILSKKLSNDKEEKLKYEKEKCYEIFEKYFNLLIDCQNKKLYDFSNNETKKEIIERLEIVKSWILENEKKHTFISYSNDVTKGINDNPTLKRKKDKKSSKIQLETIERIEKIETDLKENNYIIDELGELLNEKEKLKNDLEQETSKKGYRYDLIKGGYFHTLKNANYGIFTKKHTCLSTNDIDLFRHIISNIKKSNLSEKNKKIIKFDLNEYAQLKSVELNKTDLKREIHRSLSKLYDTSYAQFYENGSYELNHFINKVKYENGIFTLEINEEFFHLLQSEETQAITQHEKLLKLDTSKSNEIREIEGRLLEKLGDNYSRQSKEYAHMKIKTIINDLCLYDPKKDRHIERVITQISKVLENNNDMITDHYFIDTSEQKSITPQEFKNTKITKEKLFNISIAYKIERVWRIKTLSKTNTKKRTNTKKKGT